MGAPRHRLADTAHADNAQPLAQQAVAQHPVRRPALEPVFFQCRHAFHQPARHRQDKRHGHVGGVFGQNARCVGDGDAFVGGGLDVDIVHAGAEIGDQFQVGTGLGDQGRIDAVGDGGNQDIGGGDCFRQPGRAHRRIFMIEPRIKQLAHAGFHRFGQLAGDDDKRLFGHAGFLRVRAIKAQGLG